MTKIHVYFKKLTETCKLPTYGSEEAAGIDLRADLPEGRLRLGAGERVLIKCGFAMALPKNYEAQVRPRSGLALKYGITVMNSPGTIDSDYRGEVCVTLVNHGENVFLIEHGDRIAQMVIAPVVRPEMYVMKDGEELPASARGVKGLGSTGVK